jgi:hypothetical protein
MVVVPKGGIKVLVEPQVAAFSVDGKTPNVGVRIPWHFGYFNVERGRPAKLEIEVGGLPLEITVRAIA